MRAAVRRLRAQNCLRLTGRHLDHIAKTLRRVAHHRLRRSRRSAMLIICAYAQIPACCSRMDMTSNPLLTQKLAESRRTPSQEMIRRIIQNVRPVSHRSHSARSVRSYRPAARTFFLLQDLPARLVLQYLENVATSNRSRRAVQQIPEIVNGKTFANRAALFCKRAALRPARSRNAIASIARRCQKIPGATTMSSSSPPRGTSGPSEIFVPGSSGSSSFSRPPYICSYHCASGHLPRLQKPQSALPHSNNMYFHTVQGSCRVAFPHRGKRSRPLLEPAASKLQLSRAHLRFVMPSI